jgi:hypothetical protein
MAKRDLALTLDAYRAVRKIRIEAGQDVREDLSDQLAALADSISGERAPKTVRELAELSSTGLQLYAEFRNSSSIIHPGSALGRVRLDSPERAASQLALAAVLCAGFAAPVYKAVGEAG